MEKLTQMFKHVKEWRASGISMKEYSQQQGIRYKSFAYWCRKYRITEKSVVASQENNQKPINPTFVEIINNPSSVSTISKSVQIELELASGLRIKIY